MISNFIFSRLPTTPDSEAHEANTGPTWGQQDPGGPHVRNMNFAIWDVSCKGHTVLRE